MTKETDETNTRSKPNSEHGVFSFLSKFLVFIGVLGLGLSALFMLVIFNGSSYSMDLSRLPLVVSVFFGSVVFCWVGELGVLLIEINTRLGRPHN